MSNPTALFIGAHIDDIEYCCGGLAWLLHQHGYDLHFINVAPKQRIAKNNPNAEELRVQCADPTVQQEWRRQDLAAAAVLGATKTIIGESDNRFYEADGNAIEELRAVVEGLNPDIAFLHWPVDNHFEHIVAGKVAFRVLSYFTSCELHAFEAGPWQTMVHFHPDFLIDITSGMDKLKESLHTFDQPWASGAWLYKEKCQGAQFRGALAGFDLAEAYKIVSFPPAGRSPELLLPHLLGDKFRWAGAGQYRWGSRYYMDMGK
jgi:LmbE family N-acetylglucosaminyl deacetylase